MPNRKIPHSATHAVFDGIREHALAENQLKGVRSKKKQDMGKVTHDPQVRGGFVHQERDYDPDSWV